MTAHLVFQCKHVLAIKLSEAMDKVEERTISDRELADVLKSID